MGIVISEEEIKIKKDDLSRTTAGEQLSWDPLKTVFL